MLYTFMISAEEPKDSLFYFKESCLYTKKLVLLFM